MKRAIGTPRSEKPKATRNPSEFAEEANPQKAGNKNLLQPSEIEDITRKANCIRLSTGEEPKQNVEVTDCKNFLQPPEDENLSNGLTINGQFVSEIFEAILIQLPPESLLDLTLVCKSWCRIIRNDKFWSKIYRRTYKKNTKVYPWYVFYAVFTGRLDTNLIKNSNGEKGLKHWMFESETESTFAYEIEEEPAGVPPLPPGLPEFKDHRSCFSIEKTSFFVGSVYQHVDLTADKLLLYIIQKHRPRICATEWRTGYGHLIIHTRCIVNYENRPKRSAERSAQHRRLNSTITRNWTKKEINLTKYVASNLKTLTLHKEMKLARVDGVVSCVKFAGASIKVILDSIEIN